MLKIILIRHGKSIANDTHTFEGLFDNTSLSKKGILQAKKLAKKLKDEDISAIYSSDLNRAIETANEIAKIKNLNIITDCRIREFNLGEFNGKENYLEKWRLFKKNKLDEGFLEEDIRPNNGENFFDFEKKINSFLGDIIHHKGTILIVAHEGTNRILLNLIQGRTKKEFKDIKQKNTCTNTIEYINKKYRILEINNYDHLEVDF